LTTEVEATIELMEGAIMEVENFMVGELKQ
jgi:hypothetical protein